MLRTIFVTLGVLIIPLSAHASGERGNCTRAAKTAAQECTQAAKGAEQAGQAHNAGGQAQDAAHGGHNDRGAGNLCPRIQDQQKNLNNAMGQCEAAKQKCLTECNKQVEDDQTHSKPCPPKAHCVHPPEKPQPSECNKAVDPKTADLAKAAAPLAGQAAEACKSGQQAGGAPPPMQPPQKQDEQKKEEEKKEALKCESNEGVRYSDCNKYYLQKCAGAIESANCEEFASRYCGAASPGKQADVAINPESTTYRAQSYRAASVVVDKGGEGLGSGFCNMYASYKFCKNGMRNACPSCQGTHAWDSPACQNDASKCKPVLSDAQLLNAKENCPTDPIFLDPAVQKQVVAAEEAKKNEETGKNTKPPTQPGGGTGGVAGGGGGAAGGGAAGGGAKEYGAESVGSGEGSPIGTAVGSPSGGGGGYGTSSLEEDEDGDGKPDERGLSGESVMPAGAVEGMARDVSNQFGPNVFAISTAVYRQMCTTHRLTGCKPRKR